MAKKKENLEAMAKEVIERAKKEKTYIRLHYHPKAIMNAIGDLKKECNDEKMSNLFEDMEVLLKWAFERLPLVPPPTKNEDKPNS